ncbi:MAG: hypothetical protein QOF77_2053 [Solirubrobacteraceae bacterium]|jgi:hypothetical protein|nr:hypothetical protein [Solirubrobacteraceae bacterium]
MRKQRAERLRYAVSTLPPETQRAMLQGIEQNRIVTGANTDRRGGVCPMLAADRNAFAVTPLAGIFATAWDQYTGTSFVNVTRRTASDRDLKVLRSMLETSLALSSGAATEICAAAGEIRAEAAPASPAAAGPDLAETSRVLTAAAKLEVMRALEATGHTVRQPVLRAQPAVPAAQVETPAPAPAPRVEAPPALGRPARPAPRLEAPRPAPAVVAAPAPAVARSAAPPAVRPGHAGRPPATKGPTELERERARAIIANQASTLRSRAWPRPADAAPPEPRVEAAPAPSPAAVPAPLAHPTPQLGDRDRTAELQAATGWAWLRPLRSYDDYQQALHDLGEIQRPPRSADPRDDDGGHRRDDARRPQPSRA